MSDLETNKAAIYPEGDEWVVWIPPVLPEDRDGDALAAPAGESYWPTFDGALEFLVEVLNEPRRKAAMSSLRSVGRQVVQPRAIADLIASAQSVARDDRHWSVVDPADRAEAGSTLASMVLSYFAAEEDECPGDCKECEEHHQNTGHDELAGKDE